MAGNEQVTADAVVAAASVPDGTRVLTAPLDEIANRVESLDAVASAQGHARLAERTQDRGA